MEEGGAEIQTITKCDEGMSIIKEMLDAQHKEECK